MVTTLGGMSTTGAFSIIASFAMVGDTKRLVLVGCEP